MWAGWGVAPYPSSSSHWSNHICLYSPPHIFLSPSCHLESTSLGRAVSFALRPCGGPLTRPQEVPAQTGTERKTHTMRTSPKQQEKQRDPAFFPDRARVPHEIKQPSNNKMKAGAGVWMWFQPLKKERGCPQSLQGEKRQKESATILKECDLVPWLIPNQFILPQLLCRTSRGDAICASRRERGGWNEEREKWKSATLIRCRPLGHACPWFDGRGGGRAAANISFWKTSSADCSWLSFVFQSPF